MGTYYIENKLNKNQKIQMFISISQKYPKSFEN